jgi:hypothetical protein
MTSTPDPARVAEYKAKLAELLAVRDSYRAQHNDHKVRVLNRQIRGRTRWLRRAQSLAASTGRPAGRRSAPRVG